MQWFLDLVESTDYCSTIVVIILMAYVGHRMADRCHLVEWGPRLASAVFLAYWSYKIVMEWPLTPEVLFTITMQSLIAFGYALGPAWMMLAVAAFLDVQLVQPIQRHIEMCRLIHQKHLADLAELERQKNEKIRRDIELQDWERREREKPPPPPPPTREELIQRAKERYEAEIEAAEVFTDQDTKDHAIAQAETKYRKTVYELMTNQ